MSPRPLKAIVCQLKALTAHFREEEPMHRGVPLDYSFFDYLRLAFLAQDLVALLEQRVRERSGGPPDEACLYQGEGA
jgi:hypothetical protein